MIYTIVDTSNGRVVDSGEDLRQLSFRNRFRYRDALHALTEGGEFVYNNLLIVDSTINHEPRGSLKELTI